jgi:hypothetical protein
VKKYKIGIVVLALIILGLAAYIISLGVQSKEDKQTHASAQEIAEKLNAFVSEEQEIPANLSVAGIENVPSAISYEKVSGTTYHFCVTYKSDKSYGSSDVSSVLVNAAYGSQLYDNEIYEPQFLYISDDYQKGENCVTVKPQFYNIYDSSDDLFDTESIYDTYCTGSYSQVFESYCAQLESEMDGSENSSPNVEEL